MQTHDFLSLLISAQGGIQRDYLPATVYPRRRVTAVDDIAVWDGVD